jgi:hypothetical protein
MANIKKQTYEATRDGWIMDRFLKAGETIDLFPAQAAMFTPPHDDRLRLVTPAQQ